jgi:hypothetical protein
LNEAWYTILGGDPRPILTLAPEVAALVTKGLFRDVHARYTTARNAYAFGRAGLIASEFRVDL